MGVNKYSGMKTIVYSAARGTIKSSGALTANQLPLSRLRLPGRFSKLPIRRRHRSRLRVVIVFIR
jgi:hypothetical protein